MKKEYLAYLIGAVTMASCADDIANAPSQYLNGQDKTPIAIRMAFEEGPSLTRSHTRAVNGSFDEGDKLVAYLRHVKQNESGTGYDLVNSSGTEPRFVNFKVSDLTDNYEHIACTCADHATTSVLSIVDADGDPMGLYWDDFSVGKEGDATDLRTDGHYLQSYYGYCYNAETATDPYTPEIDEATGKLTWRVLTTQKGTDPERTDSTRLQQSDILWSLPQTPVRYSHNKSTADHDHQLNIPFSHAMSKVTMVIIADKGFEAGAFEKTEVTLQNVHVRCNLIPTAKNEKDRVNTEDLTEYSGNVTMYAAAEETKKVGGIDKPSCRFVAMIAPESEFVEKTPLAVIHDVDGNDYNVIVTPAMLAENAWGKDHISTTDAQNFVTADDGVKTLTTRSGYHYLITVTVSKTEIQVVTTLADWDTVEATGEGSVIYDNDDDLLVFENDETPNTPGEVSVHAVDNNKFVDGASFSLYDLKYADSMGNNFQDNDKYDYVTISTFDNKAGDTEVDEWKNTPEIYWPNRTDKFYFRALAHFKPASDGLNNISSMGELSDDGKLPEDKGTTLTQGEDILWGTSAKHYGKGPNYATDANDFRVYEEGQPIPPRTGDVPLRFYHAMSKITVNLVDGNASATLPAGVEAADYDNPLNPRINLAGAKVSIINLYDGATINLHDGSLADFTVTSEDAPFTIKDMLPASAGSGTPMLKETLVIPQSLSVDKGGNSRKVAPTFYNSRELTKIYDEGTKSIGTGKYKTYLTSELTYVPAVRYEEDEANTLNLALPAAWTFNFPEGSPSTYSVYYTAEEIIAHNATLDAEGAVKPGDIKERIFYTLEEYQEMVDHNIETQEQFEMLTEEQRTKETVLYTDETAAAHNASLDGAWSESTPKHVYSADEVYAHNALLPGAIHAGDVKEPAYYTLPEGESLTEHKSGELKSEGDKIMIYVTLDDGTLYSAELSQCEVVTSANSHHTVGSKIDRWYAGVSYVYTITLTKETISFRALVEDWKPVTGGGHATLDWD